MLEAITAKEVGTEPEAGKQCRSGQRSMAGSIPVDFLGLLNSSLVRMPDLANGPRPTLILNRCPHVGQDTFWLLTNNLSIRFGFSREQNQ